MYQVTDLPDTPACTHHFQGARGDGSDGDERVPVLAPSSHRWHLPLPVIAEQQCHSVPVSTPFPSRLFSHCVRSMCVTRLQITIQLMALDLVGVYCEMKWRVCMCVLLCFLSLNPPLLPQQLARDVYIRVLCALFLFKGQPGLDFVRVSVVSVLYPVVSFQCLISWTQ